MDEGVVSAEKRALLRGMLPVRHTCRNVKVKMPLSLIRKIR